MTTSGTYAFNPSLGEIGLYAFDMIGVRSTGLTQHHMFTLRMAANMVQARLSNQGVNLWAVDEVTVTLVQGTSTYDVDANTVMVLDAFMRTQNGDTPVDRPILPISRSEYAAYPNKTQQGFPTTYWFDRLLSPTITLWPVPDGTSAQYLKYYRVRQIQDASLTNGTNVEIPFLWLEAFADALAARLARSWAPQRVQECVAAADMSYNIAASQNTENANLYVSPMISGYFR